MMFTLMLMTHGAQAAHDPSQSVSALRRRTGTGLRIERTGDDELVINRKRMELDTIENAGIRSCILSQFCDRVTRSDIEGFRLRRALNVHPKNTELFNACQSLPKHLTNTSREAITYYAELVKIFQGRFINQNQERRFLELFRLVITVSVHFPGHYNDFVCGRFTRLDGDSEKEKVIYGTLVSPPNVRERIAWVVGEACLMGYEIHRVDDSLIYEWNRSNMPRVYSNSVSDEFIKKLLHNRDALNGQSKSVISRFLPGFTSKPKITEESQRILRARMIRAGANHYHGSTGFVCPTEEQTLFLSELCEPKTWMRY